MINPYLERTISYGENQFAYREKRGSRDVLALLVLEWMQVFDRRGNIAVYCSDVAGAFDRVDSKRLAAKLKAKGLNKRIVQLLMSWLEARIAKVVVGGEFSNEFEFINQIFQGTVLGPSLWNLFFEDSCLPIRRAGFHEITFADDLNAWREFDSNIRNTTIIKHGKKCQD